MDAGTRVELRSGIAYPLGEFYTRAGIALPRLRRIAAEALREPYRTLLDHGNDMTPTLTDFHGARLRVRVLARQRRGHLYLREVVLATEELGRPVEFGAIEIHLDRFAEAARAAILEERAPLGYILQDHGVSHTSRPSAFLRVEADRHIGEALGVDEGTVLYGRHNTHFDAGGRRLAEIVEILP